jgi:putative ATP-dependent endonuclease of OLD family
MRLVSFSLAKYRSITKAEKLALGDLTVLIGPNNEGKSNILQGLINGMKMLSVLDVPDSRGGNLKIPYSMLTRRLYDWDTDFPMHLQSRYPEGKSVFDYEFELTDAEVIEFRQHVRSSLNGHLPIRLSVGPNSWTFEVPKRGPGGSALSTKQRAIARFISGRINPREVPTIRTAGGAAALIDQMVSRELAPLEGSEPYRQALHQISDLQRPILDGLAKELTDSLREFLPDIRGIRIDLPDRAEALRRNSRIFVDDGTETELKSKGDGIQSLTALALTHYAAKEASAGRELILAIEEPEAHLHPRAIHQLRRVLNDIALTQQVVITTHSPLFVNKMQIASNVIVDKNRAKSATSIEDIRESLGVRISDNLAAAEVMLLCEGECDLRSITSLLSHMSKDIKTWFDEGVLGIDSMNGCSNLPYKASMFVDQLCTVHAFVDHDDTGRSSTERAKREGILSDADVTFASCLGMRNSEFEDLVDIELYRPAVQRKYGIDLRRGQFSRRRSKWSQRMETAFITGGQTWDPSICAAMKILVADLIVEKPNNAIRNEFIGPLQSLIASLEAKLLTR